MPPVLKGLVSSELAQRDAIAALAAAYGAGGLGALAIFVRRLGITALAPLPTWTLGVLLLLSQP